MNLTEIFTILIIHWMGDFVLQTDQQARGKSKNWKDLLSHTMNYSLCWLIPVLIIYFNKFKPYNGGLSNEDNLYISILIPKALIFILITFICHTITDYYTSRLNSKLWEEKKVHHFFVSIGFDQILHYVQLFLTYRLLK